MRNTFQYLPILGCVLMYLGAILQGKSIEAALWFIAFTLVIINKKL